MEIKKNILLSSLSDFLSPKSLFFNMLAILITITLLIMMGYMGYGSLRNFQEWLINQDLINKAEQWPFIGSSIAFTMRSAVGRFLILTPVLFLVTYTLFFMLYSFIAGLFTDIWVKIVQKRHHHDTKLKGLSLIQFVLFYIKVILTTVCLFILCVPLLFIPGLNFVLILPSYYFFHKTLTFDICSVVNSRIEYERIKKVNWTDLKTQTIVLYALSLIPVLGVLFYPFSVIYVSHYIFDETKELRFVEDFKARNA